MKRPTELHVAGETVKIRYVKRIGELGRDGNPVGGDYGDGVVRILEHQTPLAERATMIHEVLHYAVERAGGVGARRDEERLISVMDSWLLWILRENPDLVRYLTEDV